MKKIIALVVAIIMMAAIAVPAFAEVETKQFNNVGNTGTTDVIFGVDRGYTVSIPTEVRFSGLAGTAQLSVSSVKIAGDETVEIRVSSTQYADGTWVLVDNNEDGEGAPISDNVPYMIKIDVPDPNDDTPVVSGSTVVLSATTNTEDYELTIPSDVTSGTKNSVTLLFSTEGTSQVGDYRDVLTFTASVNDPTPVAP